MKRRHVTIFRLDTGECLEREVRPIVADFDGIALADVAADDLLRQGSLNRMRQQAAQRTGTEVRVEALVGQCRQRLVRPRQRDLDLLLEAVAEALEHDGRDVLDLLLLEGLEHDDVIDTVEELWTEVILEDLLDRTLRLFVALVEDLCASRGSRS